jgi:hypothetical protein
VAIFSFSKRKLRKGAQKKFFFIFENPPNHAGFCAPLKPPHDGSNGTCLADGL